MSVVESGVFSQKALDEGPKCPRCADKTTLQAGKEMASFKRMAEKIKAACNHPKKAQA